MVDSETEEGRCSICEQLIPAYSAGQCPACLLNFATGEIPEVGADHEVINENQLRHFGDYELLEQIGHGGMGVVYRARQLSLNRTLAMKMILAGQFARPDSIARFKIEAESAAKLDHPNIVPVYELGQEETQHYFTMKLIEEAVPISEWFAKLELNAPNKRFQKIADHLEKITRAVDYAHARGVLHRDIKPSNILIGGDGEPHLTDFGLAKLTSEFSIDLTHTASILGSPAYMSPEQATGEGAITTGTDVYSLGSVLYELLTGQPPFEGKTALAVLEKVKNRAPIPIRVKRREVPSDLATICMTCLEKKPSDRYASASDLAADLGRFRRGDPVSVIPRSKLSLLWLWCRRNPAISLLSAAVVLAMILGAIGIVSQRTRTEAANEALRQTVSSLQWKEIDSLVKRGERQSAVARLAAVLRASPERWQAVMFATSILDQHPFPLMVGSEVEGVSASALSPDGSLLGYADNAGLVSIIETETGMRVGPELDFAGAVQAIHFHPSADLVAVSGKESAALVFDRVSGEKITIGGPGEFRVSDDGLSLVVMEKDRLVRYGWDGLIGSSVDLGERPSGWSLSGNGDRLAVWTKDRLQGWDLQTNERLFNTAIEARIVKGSMSGNGERLALALGIDIYQLIKMEDGSKISEHSVNHLPLERSEFKYLTLNESGTRVIVILGNGTSRIFDAETFRPLSLSMSHDFHFNSVSFSSDRTRMLLAGDLRLVRYWDLENAKLLCEPLFQDRPSGALEIARESDHLLLRNDGRTSVWRPSRRLKPDRFSLPDDYYFEACNISSDNRWAMIGAGWKGAWRAEIFNRKTGEHVHTFPTKSATYAHFYHPPDDRYIAVGSGGHLQAWSLADGTPLWGPVKTDNIHPALMTPDGSLVIVGSPSGSIRIFSAHDGRLIRELELGVYPRSLDLFADGRTLLAGTNEGTVFIWDILTGEKKLEARAHDKLILASAVSADGKRFATASVDDTARIWDASTGEPVTPRLNHLEEVAHLDFSPDGKCLVTGSRDGRARIWSALDGRALTGWMAHDSAVVTVRYTADGRRIVVRSHDGFRIWDGISGLPISVTYQSPINAGLGIDSPALRDILSSDGCSVRLGVNARSASVWDITPPPDQCPDWFPDFLEAVSRLKFQKDGGFVTVPADAQLVMREKLKSLSGWHAEWARGFMERNR